VESDDLKSFVIPGRCEASSSEFRDSPMRNCASEVRSLRDRPGMTAFLTKTRRGLIAAPMKNAATIVIARRRRIIAVWADVCV
jgi:hypothetical protein